MRWKVAIQTLQLRRPFRISRGSSESRRTVLLEIHLDGLVGWGEGAPNPRYGETPEATVDALRQALPQLNGLGMQEPVAFLQAAARRLEGAWSALQALDLAVYDWWAKSQGMPLYQALGIDPEQMPLTSWTLGIDSPEAVVAQAREASDFHILKLKLGSDHDREMVEALRREDHRPLRVDANEGWSNRQQALAEIEWLADRQVEFVEQPLPAAQWDDLLWLRERTPLRLFADESFYGVPDLKRLAGAYHGINIKLAKCGGILPALRLIKEARECGLEVMLGCMVESSCGLAGAAQIAPLADMADLDSNLYLDNDPFVPLPIVEGRIQLGRRPGIARISQKGLEQGLPLVR